MRTKAKRFHGLKRIKIRPTWNKYNLYNLARVRPQQLYGNDTFYKQKWLAKSITRNYHGEHIREGLWERMFTSKIRSVIPMDYRYLGNTDGSEEAAGRGSGRDKDPRLLRRESLGVIPYMSMAYAPTERRLDIAIFRALFASSARQARQFVIHGNVKVNGKKMIHPGYLLNPGDMFQVDPERVLFATGAPKDADERRAGRKLRKRLTQLKQVAEVQEAGSKEPADENQPSAAVLSQEVAAKSRTQKSSAPAAELSEEDVAAKRQKHQLSLREMLKNAKAMLEVSKDKPSAKRKQDLRTFITSVKTAMGKAKNTETGDLDVEFNNLLSKLQISALPASQRSNSPSSALPSKDFANTTPEEDLSQSDRAALREALEVARYNPIDPSKPYATPWRPRPYMSAFAFIPRYLEVNQKICSAVYLRHPVARPGLSEVPSPFMMETHQLAFAWYLRRR